MVINSVVNNFIAMLPQCVRSAAVVYISRSLLGNNGMMGYLLLVALLLLGLNSDRSLCLCLFFKKQQPRGSVLTVERLTVH